jgi:hypothetical protein
MSRNLRARLESIGARVPSGDIETVEIWTQADADVDRYTCDARPGETRTAADFDSEPAAHGTTLVFLVGFVPPRRRS